MQTKSAHYWRNIAEKPRPTCSKSGCMHGHCVPHLHRRSHSSRTTTALKANRWMHLPIPVLLRAKTRTGATSGTKRCSGPCKKTSLEHGTPEAHYPHGQTTRTGRHKAGRGTNQGSSMSAWKLVPLSLHSGLAAGQPPGIQTKAENAVRSDAKA